MVAKNDVTGDALRTKAASKAYADNWDRIFGKKEVDTNDTLWSHNCKHNGTISIQKGSACNWCGEHEDGSLD